MQHIRYSEGLLLSCYCMCSLRMHTICPFLLQNKCTEAEIQSSKGSFFVLAVELVSTFSGPEPSSVPICTLSSSVPIPSPTLVLLLSLDSFLFLIFSQVYLPNCPQLKSQWSRMMKNSLRMEPFSNTGIALEALLERSSDNIGCACSGFA